MYQGGKAGAVRKFDILVGKIEFEFQKSRKVSQRIFQRSYFTGVSAPHLVHCRSVRSVGLGFYKVCHRLGL